MIIQCQSCAAKYFLPEEKVPDQPLKVRCPQCRGVFVLEPQPAPVSAGVGAARSKKSAKPVSAMPAAPESEVPPPAARPETAKSSPRSSRGGRSPDDRAKRLARVLVSDILYYNRERRDEALEDGTLMTALGEEIKKSWELYKEKVGPEAAQSTNYFKEALNEILANGQEVF
jgi:predicted Zn finger-like uncharacterized protein